MGKSKGKHNKSSEPKQKSFPVVTADVCEKCPIQCPSGIAYIDTVRTTTKITKGVVCKKDVYLDRQSRGLHPFNFDAIKLYKSE